MEKVRSLNNIQVYESIDHDDYIDLLKHTDVLIGNSSSGIISSTIIQLPVVNIGSRNRHRVLSDNIIYEEVDEVKIEKSVEKALYDKSYKAKVKQAKSLYGEGNASEKIVKTLRKLEVNKKLLKKQITY